MTDEEVKEVYARAEMEYEMLKDKVHYQYDEIQELKSKIDKAKEYIKTSINNPQPFYKYLYGDENGNVQNLEKLLEILGDKENE